MKGPLNIVPSDLALCTVDIVYLIILLAARNKAIRGTVLPMAVTAFVRADDFLVIDEYAVNLGARRWYC